MEGDNRFEKLFNFLTEERRRAEKLVRRTEDSSKEPPPRISSKDRNPTEGGFYGSTTQENDQRDQQSGNQPKNKCLIHPDGFHFTRKCHAFKTKSSAERAELVKNLKACPLCLSITHMNNHCPWKDKWGPCKENNCPKYHSRLLHEADTQGLLNDTYRGNLSRA